MNNIAPQDLRVLIEAARRANFAAAARKLRVSPAYVSKRIAILEEAAKAKLFCRSTRRVSLTERGEQILCWAQRVLDVYEQVDCLSIKAEPDIRGTLRIATGSALGRNYVASAVSDLIKRHPGLEIHLEIFDRSVDLMDDDIDIDVRVGEVREPHLIPHYLAPGRRILCASPDYIRSRGRPRSIADLANHSCLLIRERNEIFGRWCLQGPDGTQNVRVTAALASNQGHVVRRWAVEGNGILLRSYWDVAKDLSMGRLVHVLPDVWQPADVWAVTKIRSENSLKTRLCVRHLRTRLQSGAGALPVPPGQS